MMKFGVLEIIFISVAILMVISQGEISSVMVKNLLPVITYYYLLKKGLPFWKNRVVKITLSLSGIAFFLFPVGLHMMWLFKPYPWGSVLFFFIPFWAFLFGFLPAIVMLVKASKLKEKLEKLQ